MWVGQSCFADITSTRRSSALRAALVSTRQSLNPIRDLNSRWTGPLVGGGHGSCCSRSVRGQRFIAVLVSYCYSMLKDINEAQEELHQRVIQFYRVALDAKGIEDNIVELV